MTLPFQSFDVLRVCPSNGASHHPVELQRMYHHAAHYVVSSAPMRWPPGWRNTDKLKPHDLYGTTFATSLPSRTAALSKSIGDR
jgi:hypothetical protein